MTPEEFIAQFPDQKAINYNVLKDVACPKCGSRGEDMFSIYASASFPVHDDGTEVVAGDIAWHPSNPCTCEHCHHCGTLGDFTVNGLDDALAKTKHVDPEAPET